MGSTGFGFLVWFLLDQREGIGVFQTIADFVVQHADADDTFKGSQFLVAMLTWSFYLGARRPISTFVWSVLLQAFSPFSCPGLFESFFTSQMMAAIASVIFSFMGSVLEYSTDTVFYCMAVESESGQVDARTLQLHDLVQKQLEDEE